jgi:suppressor for copper-sensitivity B
MLIRFFILIFSGFLFLTPAAQAEQARHTTAQLFAAVKGTDGLKTIPAGIEVTLAPGWKTYWRTPGEAGLAPAFNWAGSENFKSAKISWPAPKRFVAFDIDNFGYEEKVTFPLDIVPERAGQPVRLKLKLDLLVCHDLCVPESHTLSLDIPAGAAEVSEDQPRLAAALQKIPSKEEDGAFSLQNVWLDKGEGEKADGKKTYLHAFGHAAGKPGKDADLFVESKNFISVGKPSFTYNAATGELSAQAPVHSDETQESLKKSLGNGQMTLTFTDGDRAYERTLALGGKQDSRTLQGILRGAQEHADPAVLLLAFLGGLVLNLMPCVLPVLSLKILSVLSHGGKDHRIHRWTIFRNFMASAAGIVFSFWVMAGALIALKGAGKTIGWGIQFQHPGFLVFLIAVVAFFAANMWGLFEVPLPRFVARSAPKHEHEPTLLGHFLTGAFATLLATPCTAPFLGTAVGFALAREAVDIAVVFTFIGLGLAAPYMLLALSPRIFKYMPKPGRWMVTLRKVLALALGLTAVWLIHVLITVTTQPTLDNGWTKFDEALIRPAVEDGKTVVVDITADWCLTCKANKRLVLDQKDVEAAMFVPNVLLLQADWTHRDEAISAYLKKYGRYGIPFNIIYGPGMPDGIILSELLSKKDILRALEQAAGE